MAARSEATRPGLADHLEILGVRRVEGLLVQALAEHDGLDTKGVMARTGLRQPEVSVGVRTLRERGWLESRPIPREGKGRPMHQYHLTVSRKDLRAHYENLAAETVRRHEDAAKQVRKALA